MNKFIKLIALISLLSISFTGCSNSAINKNTKDSENKKEMLETTEENENITDIMKAIDESIKNGEEKNAGVILGLKKTYEHRNKAPEYKTIWIAKNDSEIKVLKENGSIIAPYKYGFYRIEPQTFNMKKLHDYVAEETTAQPLYDYEYKFDYLNIVSSPIEKETEFIHTEEEFENKFNIDGIWSIQSQNDEILYTGNNYILIKSKYFQTGGGSYSSTWYKNTLYDLTNPGVEISKAKLISFLPEELENTLNSYKDKYDTILNSIEAQNGYRTVTERRFVDDENISLERIAGKWTAKVPLNEEYIHPGNGSNHISDVSYFELPHKPTKEITSYDNLIIPFEKIKEKIPQAKDAVSSPGRSMLVVLTDSELLVYLDPTKNFDKADYSISIEKDETIILNQWATGKYVDKWTDKFEEHLKD